MIPELRSLLKEVFHQTHTKEQSLVPNLLIVSVLRWFLGLWIVSWKLESAAFAPGCWTFSQRSMRILVRCGSSIDCCKISCCTDMQQILKAPWRQELSWVDSINDFLKLLVILEWAGSLEAHKNSKSLSLSLNVNLAMPIMKDPWTPVWSIDADMPISKRFQPGQAFACTLCETLPTFTTAISASITPLIFVGIYSAAGNFAKREAIRRTWSRIFEQQGFQVKFFLGVWAGCFSFFSGKLNNWGLQIAARGSFDANLVGLPGWYLSSFYSL